MLNRRHIRIKVMQNIYAFKQSKNTDIAKQEKYLFLSFEKLFELYIIQLNLLAGIQKFAKKRYDVMLKNRVLKLENKQGYENIISNNVLHKIAENPDFIEITQNKNLNIWQDKTEYLQLIWQDLIDSELFKNYSKIERPSFKENKEFVLKLYKELIAPNEKLLDFYESENIGWVDDLPFVNTHIIKELNNMNEYGLFKIELLFKNDDDRQFASDLFKKTILHFDEYDADIDALTPNWEFDRIAQIDLILIKMGVVEFLYFPSIPVKVTINEYIEIAKDYSSEKSSIFVNGLLDKLSKKYMEERKIKKIGRGLV
jgi:N utilization substance protein B